MDLSVGRKRHTSLNQLEAAPAHVVVSDINMPEHSGIWLLDQVKSLYHNTFVVMLPDLARCGQRSIV